LIAGEERLKNSNIVYSLEQEVVEAATLLAIINRDSFPTPDELHVTGTGYILGLTDVVGELRRYCLTQLKKGDSQEAEWGLEQMEGLYAELKNPVFPKNVINNFRRKMDGLRGLVERTRGDVITFLTQERLRTTIEETTKKPD
jgi:translin